MREIRFRGKCIEDCELKGQWLYGHYLKSASHFIAVDQGLVDGHFKLYQVDPETVGQYTGLKDDTGREAYSKDIYEDLDGKRFMVDFSDGMFTANYPHEDRLIPLIDRLNGSKFVGIYHENPELLKGEESE